MIIIEEEKGKEMGGCNEKIPKTSFSQKDIDALQELYKTLCGPGKFVTKDAFEVYPYVKT